MLFALVAAAALAGCNKDDHTIVAGGPQEDPSTAATNNEPVALPPSIQASKSYRCKDNKLVYIDWMSDGTARVKKTRDEAGTTTAEYTVVTAAAVAFGALLLKLLTGSWGSKILETAFREVIKMLGF